MPTRHPPLSYDVFVSPEKPFAAPPPSVGDPPAWDPTTSTLIFGAREAVLVDALMTVREATVLADWVALHDRRLNTIYITHGHSDHWLGLPVLLNRFPQARAVATAATVMQIHKGEQNNPFRARFPGQIADTTVQVEPLDATYFELEGLPLQVIETGHTDSVDTTSLYVPDLGLIVSGDVAYNHCHMFVSATTAAIRAEWIAAIDKLAALHPAAVVTGHKDPTCGNPPLGPGRVPRLPRILRTATRGRPARPGAVRCHGEPLSRLGQPSGVSDTRPLQIHQLTLAGMGSGSKLMILARSC